MAIAAAIALAAPASALLGLSRPEARRARRRDRRRGAPRGRHCARRQGGPRSPLPRRGRVHLNRPAGVASGRLPLQGQRRGTSRIQSNAPHRPADDGPREGHGSADRQGLRRDAAVAAAALDSPVESPGAQQVAPFLPPVDEADVHADLFTGGERAGYTVEGFDQYGNSRGDRSAQATWDVPGAAAAGTCATSTRPAARP